MNSLGRRDVLKSLGAVAGLAAIAGRSAFAADWPTQRINCVVGFNTGGGVDSITRLLMPNIEKFLKSDTVRIVNQPGAASALAVDFVWKKPADGYWWAAGSGYNRAFRVLGLHKSVPYKDWQFYGIDSSIMSWAVKPDSPIKDFGDFLDRVRKDTNSVTVSNSGPGDAWHIGNLLLERMSGVKLRQIPYADGDGVMPALTGEVQVSAAGFHEQNQHFAAGRLRNLAVATSAPLVTEQGTFQPVTNWVPELKSLTPIGGGVTFMLRRDNDPAILKRVAEALVFAINQPQFLEALKKRARVTAIYSGAAADRKAALEEVTTATLLQSAGLAKVSPKDLGLPDIKEFDSWWPPKDYKPVI